MNASESVKRAERASDAVGVQATVLVTGGAGALGGAVVRRFAGDGWRVVAVDQREPTTPGIVGVVADLFDPAEVARCAAQAAGDPDRPLRAVVNLVGGYAGGGLVHETPVEDFETQLRLNLRPTYLVCHATLPHLVSAGGGAVVCVSSRAALRPFPGAAGYITAKAAVLALCDALAVEYRNSRVRANAVLPSVIDTPANRAAQPDADYSRWVPPEQIADVIAYLCGDSSVVTSGAHMPVYGRA